jgi:transposase-like protein
MDEPKEPYDPLSLLEFQKRFPDESSCWSELVRIRWPKGNSCPDCHRPMGFVQTRRLFQCGHCRRQVSVTAGTLFHKSKIPLQKWFWAIYLMATSPKGVSMRNLQKHVGIRSYRTVWLMGHKIRSAMMQREALYKLKGKVQVDEIKLGSQSLENRRKLREDRHTRFLMGVQEGATKNYPRFVTFEELESYFKEDLLPLLEKRIAKGSRLKSDGNPTYAQAKGQGYKVHQVAFRTDREKAKKHLKWIHWVSSNIKRGLVSTYHGCFPKYRKAYLAEFAYRFNRRYWPREAFERLLFACLRGTSRTLKDIKMS